MSVRNAKTMELERAQAQAASNPAPVKKAKPAGFKIPKTMAECADMAYSLRERRLAVNREVAAIQKQEVLLKEHLIDNLPKSQASGVSGKIANAKIEKMIVPTVTDLGKFMAYARRAGQEDLLTTSPCMAAIKERWEANKKVPGIGEFTVVKVSLTKV